MKQNPTDLLSFHQVDPSRGFLPAEDPLERLPDAFLAWERVADQLPGLLMASQLRQVLAKLPALDVQRLEGEAQRRRAILLLSFFAHGYVWGEDEPATVLPAGVAIPLWQVAETLGRLPILAHASVVLHNWRRLDPSKPLQLGNLATLQLFLGGLDEQWFYLATVAIEAAGAPSLLPLATAQAAVARDHLGVVAEQLERIATVIEAMQDALLRIAERCDPYIFFHRVRPFLTGWPEPGVVYEGVSDRPYKFAGGSAAQSSLVQALDAGLDIRHEEGRSHAFLNDMRSYMPPLHRRFIKALEAGPSVRTCVLRHCQDYPALADHYNACITRLDCFRRTHMEIAVKYIMHQSSAHSQGTGGTHFVRFLKDVERDTKANLICQGR
ncbi:MAG: indoleamine 2,3-dioxygenase [Cyanobacteria bacterium J06626_18]